MLIGVIDCEGVRVRQKESTVAPALAVGILGMNFHDSYIIYARYLWCAFLGVWGSVGVNWWK